MKILFSFSVRLLDLAGTWSSDPQAVIDTDSLLARALYKALSARGTVTCIDANEAAVAGGAYDLFVGVAEGFSTIAERIDCPRTVLFTRGNHPSGLASLEQSSRSEEILVAIRRADMILCVGNNDTLNSYLAHDVPFGKIRMVNYGVGEVRPLVLPRSSTFLHRAPKVGTASGLDVVIDLALRRADDPRFRLEIMGDVDDLARKKLRGTQERLGDRCVLHGWLHADAPGYTNITDRTAFLLLPDTQGDARTALDAVREGIVPLVGASVGIDFSPFGILEPKVGSKMNHAAVGRALELDEGGRLALAERTLEYYRNYHEDSEARFGTALNALIAGNALPKLSVILPIFNKERTIKGLVRLMHRACETYGNCEAIIVFDGCKDRTEAIVRGYLEGQKPSYPVVYRSTPNVFEVKSNNLGLELATGEYGVIMQDDTYLYDRWCLHEAALYLTKNPRCVVLGGLAGVNFYPRGTVGLVGSGQIHMGEHEVYWRQDADTDPALKNRIYRTDACMRGPLILRKSFLEAHGYLDEAYVPLYNDDMDLAMRAASKGFSVQTMMMDTENKNLTQAVYSAERRAFFDAIIQKNTETFYSRWTFSTDKSRYEWINRIPLRRTPTLADAAWRTYYVKGMGFSFSRQVVQPARELAAKPVRKLRHLVGRLRRRG